MTQGLEGGVWIPNHELIFRKFLNHVACSRYRNIEQQAINYGHLRSLKCLSTTRIWFADGFSQQVRFLTLFWDHGIHRIVSVEITNHGLQKKKIPCHSQYRIHESRLGFFCIPESRTWFLPNPRSRRTPSRPWWLTGQLWSVHPSVSLSWSIFPSDSVVSQLIHLSIRPVVRHDQSVRPSVRPSVCPSVCPSVRPSVRLSVRQSVSQSVSRSVSQSVTQSAIFSLQSV